MFNKLFKYTIRVGDATSQLLNVTFLGGRPNESISGRSYRQRYESAAWGKSMKYIDSAFKALIGQENHCYNAFRNDVIRATETHKRYSSTINTENTPPL
jgi:hypothetical protein